MKTHNVLRRSATEICTPALTLVVSLLESPHTWTLLSDKRPSFQPDYLAYSGGLVWEAGSGLPGWERALARFVRGVQGRAERDFPAPVLPSQSDGGEYTRTCTAYMNKRSGLDWPF